MAFRAFWKKPSPVPTKENLPQRLQEAHESYRAAISTYNPSDPFDVTQLSTDAFSRLQHVPGVKHVERAITVKDPAKRIIHVRNAHFISKEDFAVWEPALSRRLAGERYAELLTKLEILHWREMTLFHCLAKDHGLKHVHLEGYCDTEKSRTDFSELFLAAGQPNAKRDLMLQLGPVGRLFLDGKVSKPLPCEEEALLDAAKPQGRLLNRQHVEAREDAIVRNLLQRSEPVTVVLLGADHDLRDNVRRLAPCCELIVVTPSDLPMKK